MTHGAPARPPLRRCPPGGAARLSLLALVLIAGCDLDNLPGKPNPADRPRTPQQITNFDTLYATHCAGCHGADGQLGPAPPLNDPLFLALVPDDELLHVVAEGREGTPMPAFAHANGGPLTAEQVKVLATGLKPKWGDAAVSANGFPPYRAADRGDRERGAAVFMMACATCHGARGQGTTNIGAVNDPAFLALVSDQGLRRIIVTGRPDLGMPDCAGIEGRDDEYTPLTSQQVADLVALLAYWRQGGEKK